MFEEGVLTDILEEKFKLVTENVNELILIVNHDYKIEFINKIPHLNILGYTDEDLNGKSWLKLVHVEDRKKAKNDLKFDSKHMHLIKEIRLIDKIGNVKKFEFDVRAFVDYNNTKKFMIFLKDITKLIDKREAEEKLKESEEKFRSITEQSLMGIIILQNNKVQYVNKTAAHIVNYTANEILNFPSGGYINLIYPADRKMVIKQAKKRQRGFKSKIPGYECRSLKKNGDIIWIQVYSKSMIYNGKFADLITVIDITDNKKAEIKSEESAQTLKYLLSSNPTVIYRSQITEGRVFTFISENVREMTGYSSEDFIKKSDFWNSKINPEDKDRIQSQLTNLSKNEILGLEYRFRFKDGIYHWIQDEFKIVKDEKETLLETIGSWVDVTINKRIEEKVKHQARLVDVISDAIISTDLNFNIITWNKAAESIYGWKAEEVKRKNISDIIPVEYPYDDHCNVLKDFSEMGKWKGEVIQPGKDGKLINILTSISMIKDINGNPIGAVSINRDITESKIVENKLKESEERFKYLVSSGPSIIYTSKTSGDYSATFISNNVEEKWGYDPAIFINDSEFWISHVHPDDKEHVLKELSDLFEKEHIIYEYRFKLNNGNYHWMRDEVMLIRDDSGNPIETIGSVIDITARVNVEQELKESEEKFRNIAEQTSLGLLIQQDGYVKFANSAVADMSEYSILEISNWSVEDLIKIIHEEDLPLINSKVNKVRSDNFDTSEQFECKIITKLGKIKWIEIIAKPIIYLRKKAVFATFIDITAKKKLEEELKEISRLKSELISRTSHELKTPLVSIKGYADLLLTQHYEELDFYTVSVLHEIKQGCYRLESLIKDLLETSELETGEVILNKLEDDLAFLIRFCVKDLRGLIEMRNHKLLLNIQDNLIATFEKERIYEVIMNLLSNAIKYTPPNGKISIKSKRKENNIIISVEDNGIGLANEEKEKLFKKFGKIERYGKGMDVVSEGSGLGLYISKKIIELHGGDIWVESKGRDKGSTFYFSLPILTK